MAVKTENTVEGLLMLVDKALTIRSAPIRKVIQVFAERRRMKNFISHCERGRNRSICAAAQSDQSSLSHVQFYSSWEIETQARMRLSTV